MTMANINTRVWHETYSELLTPEQRAAVDEAFTKVEEALRQHGFKAASDDVAEQLVAGITAYLIESNR